MPEKKNSEENINQYILGRSIIIIYHHQDDPSPTTALPTLNEMINSINPTTKCRATWWPTLDATFSFRALKRNRKAHPTYLSYKSIYLYTFALHNRILLLLGKVLKKRIGSAGPEYKIQNHTLGGDTWRNLYLLRQ